MAVDTFGTLAIGAIVVVAAHILFVVLRNVRAHQFFKKQSPNLPVVPNPGWFGGHAIDLFYGRKNWINVGENHKRFGRTYGAYIRDKPAISTTDLDFIKRLVIDEPDKHPNRVDLSILSNELEVDCLVTAKDDQWRRLRRATTPAFSLYKIKSANVQAEIKSVIDKFVASIDHRLDKQTEGNDKALEVDADDLFQRYSIALVFTTFYKQDDIVNFDAEIDTTVTDVDNIARSYANPLLNLSVIFPIMRPILLWLVNNFHPQGRLRAKIIDYIKQQAILNQRAKQTIDATKLSGGIVDEQNVLLAGGEKFRRNMIDYIIDEFYSGKLSAREYIHSTFFLFSAANRTTSDVLAKVFYLLASHQDVQDKLREAIASEGAASERYVTWVLLEAMRIYPPVLSGCTRTTSSDELTSDGHFVPSGTTVLTPAFLIHRLEQYWGEDAEEFRPERWADSKDFHPCQYLAFGAGKRHCPGRELALHQMRSLLVTLLPKYKFEKSPKSDGFLTFTSPLLSVNQSVKPTYVKISHLRK